MTAPVLTTTSANPNAYGSRWEMARDFGRVVTEPRTRGPLHYVECYIDGRRYRLRRVPVMGGGTLTIRSIGTAEEVLQSVRADIRNGKTKLQAIAPYLGAGSVEMLFETHWDRFVESKKRQGQRGGDGKHQRQLSSQRVQEFESHKRRGHLQPLLSVPIYSISAGVLEDWRDWLFDTFPQLAPKTVDNVVKDVGTCLRWLARRQDLPAAPPLPVTHVPEHQPKIPTPAVLERILEAIPWELRGSFLARGFMGLRPSEAWRANVGDYDFEADTLSVLGKGGRLRVLPADELVAEWIHEHVDPETTFGASPLFPNPRAEDDTGRWSRAASRRVWRRACTEVGASFQENEGLRHAFGTHAVNRKVPLDRTGAFMGHSASVTTKRYAKLSTVGLVDVLRPKIAHQSPTTRNRVETDE